jgi:hypothetical protein
MLKTFLLTCVSLHLLYQVFLGTGDDPVVQSFVIGDTGEGLVRHLQEQAQEEGLAAADASASKEKKPHQKKPQTHRRLPPIAGVNFQGLTNGVNSPSAYVPPDIIGAVGKSHYVQMVNSGIAAYFKNGSVALAPRRFNSLFVGSNLTICETRNDGDPTVSERVDE